MIRAFFWGSLVVFFLPIGEDTIDPELRVSSNDAMGAASAAFGDLSSFCDRNPDACATGRDAARYFGAKAEYSARSLYGLVTDRLGNNGPSEQTADQTTVIAPGNQEVTGIPGQPFPAPQTPGTNTLTVDDLNVRWDVPGTL